MTPATAGTGRDADPSLRGIPASRFGQRRHVQHLERHVDDADRMLVRVRVPRSPHPARRRRRRRTGVRDVRRRDRQVRDRRQRLLLPAGGRHDLRRPRDHVHRVADPSSGVTHSPSRKALANALDLRRRSASPVRSKATIEPRMTHLLDQADPSPTSCMALRRHLDEMPERPDIDAWWETIPRWVAAHYHRIVARPAVHAPADRRRDRLCSSRPVTSSLLVVVTAQRERDASECRRCSAQIVSTVVGAALIGRGVLLLPGSRVEAYRWFLRGILVWLLVTQVFVFYSSQLAGLGGLAIDLAAYVMVRYRDQPRVGSVRSAAVVGRAGQHDPGPRSGPRRARGRRSRPGTRPGRRSGSGR